MNRNVNIYLLPHTNLEKPRRTWQASKASEDLENEN